MDKKEFIEEREKLWKEKKGTLTYGIDLKFFSTTTSEPKKLEKRYKLPLDVLTQVAENFPTVRIEDAIARYLQKTSTNLNHYESLEKNRRLADNLADSRTSFCGIGTRKTKIRLNKLAAADVPMAKILRTALEIEDINITAKKSSYFYSQKIYRKKETMLAELAELCRQSDVTFGIQRTNNHSTSFILYFEIPDAGQISFHTNAIKGDWPVYQGTWDGRRNSTLGKIEKAVLQMFRRYNVELKNECNKFFTLPTLQVGSKTASVKKEPDSAIQHTMQIRNCRTGLYRYRIDRCLGNNRRIHSNHRG